jgi:hypothetical protein
MIMIKIMGTMLKNVEDMHVLTCIMYVFRALIGL